MKMQGEEIETPNNSNAALNLKLKWVLDSVHANNVLIEEPTNGFLKTKHANKTLAIHVPQYRNTTMQLIINLKSFWTINNGTEQKRGTVKGTLWVNNGGFRWYLKVVYNKNSGNVSEVKSGLPFYAAVQILKVRAFMDDEESLNNNTDAKRKWEKWWEVVKSGARAEVIDFLDSKKEYTPSYQRLSPFVLQCIFLVKPALQIKVNESPAWYSCLIVIERFEGQLLGNIIGCNWRRTNNSVRRKAQSVKSTSYWKGTFNK